MLVRCRGEEELYQAEGEDIARRHLSQSHKNLPAILSFGKRIGRLAMIDDSCYPWQTLMKKQRLIFGISGVLLLMVLVVSTGWFWSLSAVHAGATPSITAEIVRPPVEIRRAAQEDWAELSASAVILPGDRIRTGPDGEARLVWGDRGYTRIDPGTELLVEQAPLDGTLTPGAKIALVVEGGRIWSRMLKLLDLDSSMQVRTSDVVATVRGTTFGIIKDADGSQAAVTESVVEVSGSDATTLLRDNQWGLFLAGGVPQEVRDLRADDTWAQGHARRDREDDAFFADYLRRRSERRASELKGAPLFLIDLSERLRLRLASRQEAPRLAATYGERRLARALASGAERDWKALLGYADQAGEEKGRLLGLIHAHLTTRARSQGVEVVSFERAFRRALAEPADASRAYLDALQIDERLDDVILRQSLRDPLTFGQIAEEIQTFENRIDRLDAAETDKEGLRKKATALRKRLEYAIGLPGAEPPSDPVPEPVTDPIQGSQVPDTAKPPTQVIKPPTESTPTQEPTQGETSYVRYSLLAAPSVVDLGQAVRLSLYGITAEGRAEDLTAASVFSAARPSDGSFVGNVFTPAVAGSVRLNGAYSDRAGTHIASATITVNAPAATQNLLQRLQISFTGPTTLPCSGRSSFKVLATYGDGRTADVTMFAKLSVSNAQLIYANNEGTLLSFCAAETSTGTLTASYTEDQVTRSASATITVEPEPPPSTGGGQTGGTGYPYYLY